VSATALSDSRLGRAAGRQGRNPDPQEVPVSNPPEPTRGPPSGKAFHSPGQGGGKRDQQPAVLYLAPVRLDDLWADYYNENLKGA